MTSRKFNRRRDSDKQTIFHGLLLWEWRVEQQCSWTLHRDTQRLIMSEGCLRILSFTSIAEKKVVSDIQVYHSQESQQPGKWNTIKISWRRSDPIRCLALMKLACSVFAYKEQSKPALFKLHVSCQTYEWNICSWDLLTVTDLFLRSDGYGSIRV